ncbi:MAG: hypothetical protein Q7K13_00665, partial [Polynucleobacter sp.]|nr:hypothetical protein [Polynucleobacter sp.]
SSFSVSGNAAIGSSYATVAAPTNGLIVQGSVGIGTTSPEAKLDVAGPMRVSSAGDVGISHDLYFEDITSANINSYGPLTIQSGNPNSNHDLVLKGSGTGKVIVDDDFSATGNIALGDAVADTVSIHGTVIGASPALFVNQSSADDIVVVQDSGTNVFKILDGGNSYFMGNLGIGTTNPGAKLEIANSVTAGLKFRDATGVQATLSVSEADHDLKISTAGEDVQFLNEATPLVMIKAAGNVGIGTTVPTGKLHVSGGNLYLDNGANIKGNFGIQDGSGSESFTIGGGRIQILSGHPLVGNGGPIYIQGPGSTNIALIVKGTSDQTGDLQRWQDSSGNVFVDVTAAGNVGIGTT